ncbi:hypothetical protein NKI39_32650 [Mesorhizobium sp. M0664]|uniref:hypothetical protein n=1 Tax=Mesorhizobium sp. M0664 TaxID=2956982 RepID=UPI00333BC307
MIEAEFFLHLLMGLLADPSSIDNNRETVVTKARRRRSGGRAAKADVLTRGDLA